MLKIIDPHLHFFDIENGHYHWLKPDNPPSWPDKAKIARGFGESDISFSDGTSPVGYVHIEAGYDNDKNWREIEWLEKNATLPFRSVANADLTKPANEFKQNIKKLTQYQSVVGVRHIFDEQALELLSNDNVISNLAYLSEQKLSFDLQMPLTDTMAVQSLLTRVEQLPELAIILNHGGFPPQLNHEGWQDWVSHLSALAKYINVAVKCSGWEMSKRDYDMNWVVKVIRECVARFGENRVMLASNFPLCLFSTNYQNIWAHYQAQSFLKNKALLHDNALHWYKF